jgi:hypothetical protein|tara:strand:+ start:1620 stop:1748 length:129 start_codon:yes stop_codon:yes gene_type:complete
MPIWFEVIVLMLVAYGGGVLLGWAIWHSAAEPGMDADEGDDL